VDYRGQQGRDDREEIDIGYNDHICEDENILRKGGVNEEAIAGYWIIHQQKVRLTTARRRQQQLQNRVNGAYLRTAEIRYFPVQVATMAPSRSSTATSTSEDPLKESPPGSISYWFSS
jgi:hypothetical protein